MKSTPLKSNAALRHTAKKRLRAVPPAGEAQSLRDLRSAMGELRIDEAELEIQHEELRDSLDRFLPDDHRPHGAARDRPNAHATKGPGRGRRDLQRTFFRNAFA